MGFESTHSETTEPDADRLVIDANRLISDGPLAGSDASGVDGSTDAGDSLLVAVNMMGTGAGSITSVPGGITCPPTCSAQFGTQTIVRLEANPDSNSVFDGWSGGGCSGTGDCLVQPPANVTGEFSAPKNVLFTMTTSQALGLYGDPAALDAECTARAAAAGLAGNYVAWVSTTASPVIDRLGAASGWVRRDGKTVAVTRADLLAGTLIYPPNMTVLGALIQNDPPSLITHHVATGTNADGTASGVDCDGLTDTGIKMSGGSVFAGSSRFTTGSSTFSNQLSCDRMVSIYCFGIDWSNPAPITPPSPARIAFITSADWSPGGGRDAADMFCQSEATAAGLPGTFLAFINTTTATAASRFDETGPPWIRLDGAVLANPPSELMRGLPEAPIHITATGGARTEQFSEVWTGGVTPDQLGIRTCDDWNASTVTFSGDTGKDITLSNLEFWAAGGRGCSGTASLYCLQQ